MSLLKEALRQIKDKDLSVSLDADEVKTLVVPLQNDGTVGLLGNFSLYAEVTGGTVTVSVQSGMSETKLGIAQTIVTQADGEDATHTAFSTPVATHLKFTFTETASVASEATLTLGVQ